MKNAKTYESEVFAAIHETAVGMCDAGVIDKQPMWSFDHACLTPIHELTAAEICALREREEVSQLVFARYLNVAMDYVSKWGAWRKVTRRPSSQSSSVCRTMAEQTESQAAPGNGLFKLETTGTTSQKFYESHATVFLLLSNMSY